MIYMLRLGYFISLNLRDVHECTLIQFLSSMIPQFFWPAVRDGLKLRLGDKFTVKVELAWKHLYDYVTSKISEGIEMNRDIKKKIPL